MPQPSVSVHEGDIVEFDLQNTAASLLQNSFASVCMEDEVDYDLHNPWDFIDCLIDATILLVELSYKKITC